jgi:hypothetical protein
MKNFLKNSIATLALFMAFGAFAQTSNAFTLPLDAFYTKIKSQNKPQIIDARSPEEFALNHICSGI